MFSTFSPAIRAWSSFFELAAVEGHAAVDDEQVRMAVLQIAQRDALSGGEIGDVDRRILVDRQRAGLLAGGDDRQQPTASVVG